MIENKDAMIRPSAYREERNPNDRRPLDIEDYENPYVKKDGENYEEKMKRLNRAKKMLRDNVTAEIGVKKSSLLDAFKKGKGGD